MSNLVQFILLNVVLSNIVGVISSSNYFETYFVPPPKVNGNSRNALKLKDYLWPNGVVHYVFDSAYNEDDQAAVRNAMTLIADKTCIKFKVKSSSQKEHIRFLKSLFGVCGANIGYRPNQSKPLDVNFAEGCLKSSGAIQHELCHVLGLLHEQSRPDRDDHIRILWENIDPRFHGNFQKGDNSSLETFDLPYDYDSLMHYPGNAFALIGKNVTIESKKDPSRKLGQSIGPTFYDLEKIRRMYDCS